MALVQQVVNKAMIFAFSRASALTTSTSWTQSKEFRELFDVVSQTKADDLSYKMEEIFTNDDVFLVPCIYMNIHENEYLNASVFTLQANKEIPLHDHPGMLGILKVIQGSVRVSRYSFLGANQRSQVIEEWEKRSGGQRIGKLFSQSLNRWEEKHVLPVIAHGEYTLTADDPPSVLTPAEYNIHRIRATDENAAFFDVLVPPYYPSDPSRNCHYFQVMPVKEQLKVNNESSSGSPTGQPSQLTGPVEDGVDGKEKTEGSSGGSSRKIDVAWLRRIPPPHTYFCEDMPFRGPFAKALTETEMREITKKA